MTKKALILVDLQNDFLPNGSMAVKNSDEILPVINQLTSLPFDLIIATKDWHPKDHSSFAATHHKKPREKIMLEGIEQILWPIHCVQETKGAEFSPHLNAKKISKIFYKGTDKAIDSYSTFYDNKHRKSTGLADFLNVQKIQELYFAGLTTEYCVKYSVLDALDLGFNTYVITDACRGIDINENDSENAYNEMKHAGAFLSTAKDLMNLFKI